MKRERGYAVHVGGKVHHVHAFTFLEEFDSKIFFCPVHGKGKSAFLVKVMVEEFPAKSATVKNTVEGAIRKFLKNRKVICKSCMQGLSG